MATVTNDRLIRLQGAIKRAKIGELSWWFSLIIIFLSFLAFGYIGWPGMHWDSAAYAAPILNVASGKGWLSNPFHYGLGEAETIWLTIKNRPYNTHGMLHVIIYGKFLGITTYERLFIWMGFINATTFASFALLMKRVMNGVSRLHLPSSLLIGLMAGVICLNIQGRQEQLIPLMLSIYLWFATFNNRKNHLLVSGAIITGIVFTTSPLPGVLCGLIFLICSSLLDKDSPWRFWGRMVIFGILAIATSGIIMYTFTPYGLAEWLQRTADIEGVAYDFSKYLFGFDLIKGNSTYSPLWNIMAISLAATCIGVLAVKKKLVTLALTAAILIRIMPKANDYTYMVFFPIVPWLLLIGNQRLIIPTPYQGLFKLIRGYLTQLTYLVAALYGVSYLTALYFAVSYSAKQTTFHTANQRLKRSLKREELESQITFAYPALSNPAFVAFAKDGSKQFVATTYPGLTPTTELHPVERMENSLNNKIEYFILPQGKLRDTINPDIVYLGSLRFKLVKSEGVEKVAETLPILKPFRLYWPDYSYALYKREA